MALNWQVWLNPTRHNFEKPIDQIRIKEIAIEDEKLRRERIGVGFCDSRVKDSSAQIELTNSRRPVNEDVGG